MMTEDDFKYLKGKTEEEAKKDLPPRYFIFVADREGQTFYRSLEFNPFRINVRVKGGHITHIDGIN
jgi:hypothetical protein